MRATTFRGRGPDRAFGRLELRFTAWEGCSGVLLPTAWEAWFDAERATELDRELTSISKGVPLEGHTFERRDARGPSRDQDDS